MPNDGSRFSTLSPRERQRYARHLVLPQIGESGQQRLKAARVLIVGMGGLGSAIALYLAGAGIGHLGLVDDDVVGLSNLQRQVLHGTSWLGKPKVFSAKHRLADLNPDIDVTALAVRFSRDDGAKIAAGYDLIVDGTDNFPSRYDINSTCLELGIPYIYGAIFRFEGQASVLCTDIGPCYRCIFPSAPSEPVPSGEQAGILGAIPGTIGTIQATEAIKNIVGIGTPLVGRLLIYDGAAMQFETIKLAKNPQCPDCRSPSQA